MNVPRSIATCPDCNRALELEVDEWEADTGIPTETGCKPYCQRSHPNTEASHMPYVYWLPLEQKVYAWVREHVRVVDRDGEPIQLVPTAEYQRAREQAELDAWNAWARDEALAAIRVEGDT